MAVIRPRPAARGVQPGFTLIELLVVVTIIVIVVGLLGVQLSRGPEDQVREESEQLARLLKAAREEAILQGRVFALGSERDAYWFLRLERDGRLKVLRGDELLRNRQLPAGMIIEKLQVEGQGAGDSAREGLVFLPSGELPAFRLVLASGGARWSVVGAPGGAILAKAGS
jgi:type II secretion system protein H